MHASWIFLIAVVALMAAAVVLRRHWLPPLAAKIDANVHWSGNFAQLASAAIALVGFTGVIVQIMESREKAAHDALRADLGDARRLYLTYSDATLRYPELTQPDYGRLTRSAAGFVRYKNFVDHMIYAYDDTLSAVEAYEDAADIRAWQNSFAEDVRPHRRYLCQAGDAFYGQYRDTMVDRIKAVIAPCDGVKPLVVQPDDGRDAGPG